MQHFSFPVRGNPVPVFMPEDSGDLDTFRHWVAARARLGERVAVDTEGKGLKVLNGEPGYVRLVQFGTADVAWNIPIEFGGAFHETAKWALHTLPALVGHNWNGFDALALHKTFDLDYETLCGKALDTWLLANLVDPRKPEEGGIGTGLKPLSAHHVDPSAPDTQHGLEAPHRPFS